MNDPCRKFASRDKPGLIMHLSLQLGVVATVGLVLGVVLYHLPELRTRMPHTEPSLPVPKEENAKMICIVGGGLAGLAAALAAHEEASARAVQVSILIIDKEAKLGGNSAKASSGINSLNEPAGDAPELFKGDTLRSGGGLSDEGLVDTLVVRVSGHPCHARREGRRLIRLFA